jgi:flagellar basal-body rod protein FlgC
MSNVLSIALSGLNAQNVRISAAANNIANASTVGALPTADNPASTVYKPLSVSYTALTAGANNGGVSAQVIEEQNAYTPVFDPSSPFANEEGLVAAPNVDLAKEAVNLLESKVLFKANLSVIKTQKEMLGEVLDIFK